MTPSDAAIEPARAFDGKGRGDIHYVRPDIREFADVASFHAQCWREAYGAIVPQELVARFDAARLAERWKGYLARQDRFIIAAYDGPTIIGFVNQGVPIAPLHDGCDGHIAALYVAQSHYRRGVGKMLLALAAWDWLRKGGHAISLGVLAENGRARAFYEAMGGQVVKTGFYDWDGFKLADVIYQFANLADLARPAQAQNLRQNDQIS